MTIAFPIKQLNTLDSDISGQKVYSNNYNDIYFQADIGMAEKQHVFLKGNNLPKNWQQHAHFTIAETGFGTGLNFLNTFKLWHKNNNGKQHLHYISCELHPFKRQQLQQILVAFPELEEYSKELLEKYPTILTYGFHRLHFQQYNLTLTLIFADCVTAFEQLQANVDAWFLDGFGPSKNPNMWSDRLFRVIANLSHINTSLATFTVARKIRDGLSAVGFSINKAPGFGQKREMLTAQMGKDAVTKEKQPWAQTFKAKKAKTYAVIGAGIAGLSLADKLQQQGRKVVLFDRQRQPCLETSGNPQAMIMPALTLNDSPEARFYLTAFLYALRYYDKKYYHPVGVQQLAFSNKQKNWQNKLIERFDLPEQLLTKTEAGLFYPLAGWLDTQGHAQNMGQNLNYQQAEIIKIDRDKEQWHMQGLDGAIYTTDVLILANGMNAKKLLNGYDLPITPKHGQISYFQANDSHKQIGACPHIQLAEGYITPSWHGIQTLGATFDHIDEPICYGAASTEKDHWQRNTSLWNGTDYEDYFKSLSSHKARAGIRATTADHLPICGAIIKQSQFRLDYHDIHHGKHWKQYPLPQAVENLYVLTGLGSRGFTSAPLLAESLCNQILATPQVLSHELQKAINPNRFLFKELKRK